MHGMWRKKFPPHPGNSLTVTGTLHAKVGGLHCITIDMYRLASDDLICLCEYCQIEILEYRDNFFMVVKSTDIFNTFKNERLCLT